MNHRNGLLVCDLSNLLDLVCEMSNGQAMSIATVKDRTPLLPERRPIPDFFVCDLMDAAPKGDMASMEHPIFSLSTKPDHRIRR